MIYHRTYISNKLDYNKRIVYQLSQNSRWYNIPNKSSFLFSFTWEFSLFDSRCLMENSWNSINHWLFQSENKWYFLNLTCSKSYLKEDVLLVFHESIQWEYTVLFNTRHYKDRHNYLKLIETFVLTWTNKAKMIL